MASTGLRTSEESLWPEEAHSSIEVPCVRALREPEDTLRATLPTIMAAQALGNLLDESGRLDTPLLPARPVLSASARATLTVMSGSEAGRVVALDDEVVTIGRDPEASLWVEDASVSRNHARIARAPDGSYYVEDLNSTNGTFVEGTRIRVHGLDPGAHIQLGSGFLIRFAITDSNDEHLQRQLFESAVRDPLTHAFNRKYLESRLDAEVARARRHQGAMSLLMIDLDHFKQLNDRHGHVVGDNVLRFTVAQMSELTRAEDVLARYGGEEFVVLARDADAIAGARLAERLRRGVAGLRFTSRGSAFSVTVSIGVASLTEIDPADAPGVLTSLADARLYGAKLRGRNCVCTE